MKVRLGLISNSSSSSFIIAVKKKVRSGINADQFEYLGKCLEFDAIGYKEVIEQVREDWDFSPEDEKEFFKDLIKNDRSEEFQYFYGRINRDAGRLFNGILSLMNESGNAIIFKWELE